MIGIQEIGIYLPEGKLSNYDLKDKFDMDDHFIEEKIGVRSVTKKSSDEDTSDLGVKAFKNLQEKVDIDLNSIECLFLVTQNPDYNLPHTSAIIHGKLNLPTKCACFDISLGCSGFVYGLSVIESFMTQNKMKKGVLITSDPYSKVINPDDKNTSILFGDGATATFITDSPTYLSGEFSFGTIGKEHKGLICENDILHMNGRAIFNFVAKTIPKDIKGILQKNNLQNEDIDCFVLHQGSKYVVDTLRKRLKLDTQKVPFHISDYGNTIASSIPMILSDTIKNADTNTVLISGFGVGLSWASTILKKIN